MAQLRVFTFTPAWGLPSSGPFALKLLAWLNLAGIAYEQAFEDDPRKGPLGKSPGSSLMASVSVIPNTSSSFWGSDTAKAWTMD